MTSEGSTIGTWAYMAPERFRTSEIQPSSDIYALACVLYQCLTGEQPFPGSTLEQVAVGHMVTPPPRPSEHAAIPAAMDQVIATGLAKQTADRYPTAVEMAAAAKEAITEPIETTGQHAPHTGRRRRGPRSHGRAGLYLPADPAGAPYGMPPPPQSRTAVRASRRRHRRRSQRQATGS